MALNLLHKLVLRVASKGDHKAALREVSAAMGTVPAFPSLPGRKTPGFAGAVMEPRATWAGTGDFGTAQAVVRAGRPRSLACVPGTPILGRNPRGTIQSRWSRINRLASQRLMLQRIARQPRCYRGNPMAYVQG
ncbi:MAG: hypothetical protein HY040_13500 [Planctomycetes bacterium]|nr:hypothetical protein [Planctomycetota bacterium]